MYENEILRKQLNMPPMEDVEMEQQVQNHIQQQNQIHHQAATQHQIIQHVQRNWRHRNVQTVAEIVFIYCHMCSLRCCSVSSLPTTLLNCLCANYFDFVWYCSLCTSSSLCVLAWMHVALLKLFTGDWPGRLGVVVVAIVRLPPRLVHTGFERTLPCLHAFFTVCLLFFVSLCRLLIFFCPFVYCINVIGLDVLQEIDSTHYAFFPTVLLSFVCAVLIFPLRFCS